MEYILDTQPRLVQTQQALKPYHFDGVELLDVGSRDGRSVEEVRARVKARRLAAIDMHHRVENGIEFISHDLEQPLPFPDNSFDCVICTDVLEHVEWKNQLAREVARVSRKGVIFSLPNTQHKSYVRGLQDGNMGSKYVFDQEDGSDRHRWVTFYNSNIEFVAKHFVPVRQIDICDKRSHVWKARFNPSKYVRNMFFVCETR